MMNSIIIQTQSERQEYNYNDLITKIESILPTVESIYEQNIIAIASGTGIWFQPEIDNRFRTATLLQCPVAGSLALSFNEDLGELIINTKRVVQACRERVPLLNIFFIHEIRSSQPNYYRYALGCAIPANICPQCRGPYTSSGMSSHIGSLRCMRDQQCLDVMDDGYIIMDDSSAVSAIRKAGIEFKVRPSALDMWVPTWVAQAVKDYRKNKNYAGLKLHEFLKAVQGNG